MALSTPAHFERVYSHIAFTLENKRLGVMQAPEFWTEILWLSDQILEGMQAPPTVRHDVTTWSVSVRKDKLAKTKHSAGSVNPVQINAPLETTEEHLVLCKRFLNKAALLREQWTDEDARTGLESRRSALITIGRADLSRCNYSKDYNPEDQVSLLKTELDLLIGLGRIDQVNAASTTFKEIQKTKTASPTKTEANKASAIPVIALKPPKKKISRALRPATDYSHREEWLRPVPEKPDFRTTVPTLEIRNSSGKKLSKIERKRTEIALQLMGLENRYAALMRKYSWVSPARYPELKRSRKSLIEHIMEFWSDYDNLLTSVQEERIRVLRVEAINLQPPAKKKGTDQWVQVVRGGAPSLGKRSK